MKTDTLDILIYSPHPDDAELLCGGLIAKSVEQGHKVGIIELTQGEMGSQGDVQIRKKELTESAKVLGIFYRDNLELPDCFLNPYDFSQIAKVVQSIRKNKPSTICAPYEVDRHPDHEATSDIVTKAVFYAGASKFMPELGERHVVDQVIYYQLREFMKPTFLVDITTVHDKKLLAIKCFKSQIERKSVNTNVNSPNLLDSIIARDRVYGAMIGVDFAEPFWVRTALSIKDPVALFKSKRTYDVLFNPPS